MAAGEMDDATRGGLHDSFWRNNTDSRLVAVLLLATFPWGLELSFLRASHFFLSVVSLAAVTPQARIYGKEWRGQRVGVQLPCGTPP